jgi:hypothetical protein
MRKFLLLLVSVLAILAGCKPQPLPPVEIQPPARPINYVQEVRPVLERRCVVCHSCYNSPCQLKLSAYEGVDRGATKKQVYDAMREKAMDPTRLFVDAENTAQWRQKGFFSVTENDAAPGYNDSLMLQLLSHKMHHPVSSGDYYPEKDLTCAGSKDELGGFLTKHPNRGMPFGFPPLSEDEFQIVAGWLAQGAPGPTPAQIQALTTPDARTQPQIARWEEFLNAPDAKHQMTARYLYEHLFLADIWFSAGDPSEFYELVRSTTGPGQAIEIIPSLRPYDDPGHRPFFYRFRKIHSTIVEKTHMVYAANDAVLARLNTLFIEPVWEQEPHVADYDAKQSANPFVSFAQIPPRSRYQFLLDNAEYIIMTFIRGPVCKGQIALDVIQDHFWLLFMDPDHDLSVSFPGFLTEHADDLKMPIEEGSNAPTFDYLRQRYHQRAVKFYHARQDLYASHSPKGLALDAIWPGRSASDAPLLTVFRHFDSASVYRGLLGGLPRTLWVIDYPLLERIYYNLVAGFDVYGNFFHQAGVRLYMDALRIEAESYFLDFLPQEQRQALMQDWYQNINFALVGYYPSSMPAGIDFTTGNPKREFMERLVRERIFARTGIGFDPLNYLKEGQEYPPLPEHYQGMQDYLQGFRAVSAPGTAFFKFVHDHNANVAYIRIRMPKGIDAVVSVVVHRWHDNVKFMLGDDLFENPAKDQAEFFPGFIGSYPNYFFDIKQEELPDFFALLSKFNSSETDMQKLEEYGINRADPRFWTEYDWFQRQFNGRKHEKSGLFDLNRYYHKAL